MRNDIIKFAGLVIDVFILPLELYSAYSGNEIDINDFVCFIIGEHKNILPDRHSIKQ